MSGDSRSKKKERFVTDPLNEKVEETDRKIRARIMYLNKEGGFNNTIFYPRIKDASVGLTSHQIMPVFMRLQLHKDTIPDPTTYVCNELYRLVAQIRAAGFDCNSGNFGPGAMIGVEDNRPIDDVERKMRARVMWLNKEGGFANGIHYNKVKDAAMGLSVSQIMTVLKSLEQNRDDATDPTDFIVRNMKSYKDWAAGALNVESATGTLAEVPAANEWMSPQEWMNMMFVQVEQQTKEAKIQEEAKKEQEKTDWKLRVRLMWLNNEGGFNNKINYRRVFEVAVGLPCEVTMNVLEEAQRLRDELPDPTAFICELLNNQRLALPVADPAAQPQLALMAPTAVRPEHSHMASIEPIVQPQAIPQQQFLAQPAGMAQQAMFLAQPQLGALPGGLSGLTPEQAQALLLAQQAQMSSYGPAAMQMASHGVQPY